MALRFGRPVAVFGPDVPGVGLAEKFLRRRGFEVESLTPTPGNVADFVSKRDGLIVWIAAELSDEETRDRAVSLKWHGGINGAEPNSFHAWRTAQVIVHYDCGRVWFYRWLRQLVAELTYPEHLSFMTWKEQHGQLLPVPASLVGEELWQLYVLTKPFSHAV